MISAAALLHAGVWRLAALAQASAPANPSSLRRLRALYAILLLTFLLLVVFLVAALAVNRIRRARFRARHPDGPTRYVDAWRVVRLTDDDIAAATQEPRPDDDSDSKNTRGE